MGLGTHPGARLLRDKIKNDIDLGLADVAISDKYGCCILLVERIRRSMGIFKTQFSDRQYRTMWLILNTDKTWYAIADECDICVNTVHETSKKLKKHGFDFPKRPLGRPKSMVIQPPPE